jgi:peptide/nickel transport system ATP-binding protein
VNPLLTLRDISVNYGQLRGQRGRPRSRVADAISGVSLHIGHGETVALVGESGSGKSTVGNVVLGLVPVTSGTISFEGEDITHASPHRRRQLTRQIQPIFQDPYASLNPVRTVHQTLVEPLVAHERLTRAQARARVAEALARVGLERDAADRYPAEFSGGQRQRIAVARALMVAPRLIVCDEPTSALDLSVQAQVLNLLTRLRRELGVSYLFITHDLALIRHIADRVAVLHHGQIVEAGPATQVCDHPRDPYTRDLIAAAPVPDPVEQRRRRTLLAEPRMATLGPHEETSSGPRAAGSGR